MKDTTESTIKSLAYVYSSPTNALDWRTPSAKYIPDTGGV